MRAPAIQAKKTAPKAAPPITPAIEWRLDTVEGDVTGRCPKDSAPIGSATRVASIVKP